MEKSLGEREKERLNEFLEAKQQELDRMKLHYARLQKQFDNEITKREKAEGDTAMLERQVVDAYEMKIVAKHEKEKDSDQTQTDPTQVSSKIFRAIDQWMRYKDLNQALLRNSALTDIAFSTLSQMLHGCPSLHTLDLSCNQLTMDSCSDVCQLITVLPNLTYVSVESNDFSCRALGYFMTALMERQAGRNLTPLDLLDFQNNEGLIMFMEEPEPNREYMDLWPHVKNYADPIPQLLVGITKTLWSFLHDTGHPQVKDLGLDPPLFHELERPTLAKMKAALSKILLVDDNQDITKSTAYTCDMAILMPSEGEPAEIEEKEKPEEAPTGGVTLPPVKGAQDAEPKIVRAQEKVRKEERQPSKQVKGPAGPEQMAKLRDPFVDLTVAFEKPREKCNTLNMKQILTKSGAILMNMLERLLETTSINARDLETGQTLLEYACLHGNLGLAKLCYRRGANLNGRTLSGNTPFNICVENKRYDLMEFLHLYGVKVNSADAEGRTGLHVATSKNDIDAICRLIEWGADINLRDKKKRTPFHMAAIGGHEKVSMLLLEMGADINAKDEKEFTAVAHAEANDKYQLMDRLVILGGLGHGLQKSKSGVPVANAGIGKSGMNKNLGELNVTAGVRKRTCLGRLGKHKSEVALPWTGKAGTK